MSTACIYTLEPLEQGGVIAKVREVTALHQRFGHTVRLMYTATNQVPTSYRWAKLLYFLRTWPKWETRLGFRGFAIPDWPMPLWASYAVPALAGLPLIQSSDLHIVVSGSNHCGLPAALLHKTYVVWIGTLYQEELQGRAAAGEAWAQRMLTGPARAILAWQEKLVFGRAAMILTNGDHTAEAVKREYPAAAARVRTLIYPVDTEVYKPNPALLLANQSPYLLFSARINDPRKNIGLLFRAWARVRVRHPNLRLVLTGDQPDARVKQMLTESNAEAGVVFVGYQTREALVKLYQQAELFLLPSLQEGLGIAMLEALACGLPVVSTRCGGPESVIVDNLTGRLTPNDDVEAFANTILELLANPATLKGMRVRSAQFARENFSKQVVENRLLEAFQTVYPGYFDVRTESTKAKEIVGTGL